jgi:hypothetical protein
MENPIDKDKVAENPGLLPYAHHAGSALIKPEDRGKIKSKALSAMYEQTDMQMKNIHEQIRLLAAQAQSIKNRVEVSESIYQTNLRFDPLVGHTYYLYKDQEGNTSLSIIAPHEWGKVCPFAEFVSTVKLLADHTWEVIF